MKKRFIILLVVLLVATMLVACGKKEMIEAVDLSNSQVLDDISMRDTMLYFLDENDYMLPVQTKLKWEEGIGKAALSQLVSGQETDIRLASLGLYPPIPSGVTFELDIRDGMAMVDVETNGAELPQGTKKKRMFNCMANTLMSFESVNKVTIRVDGEEVDVFAQAQDADITETAANYEPIGSEQNEDVQYANLYFISAKGDFLVPVKRLTSDQNPANIVGELQCPLESTTLASAIPTSVDVLNVEADGTIVTVNFSKEFEQLMDEPNQQRLALTALNKTLTSIEGISSVQIQIEGKKYDGTVQTSAGMGFYNIVE